MAESDAKQGKWEATLDHLKLSLRLNGDSLNARNLSAIALLKLGRNADAEKILHETRALDPLDSWAQYLAHRSLPHDNQMLFDLALDYARIGLYGESVEILEHANQEARDGSLPIIFYAQSHFRRLMGDEAGAQRMSSEAKQTSPDYCFPSRLEEFIILQEAVKADSKDSRAPYYLGNLLYDRRRHLEAIALWEQSSRLDPSFSVIWRNLGIAYFNVRGYAALARSAFNKALQANPTDARVLYERDQLWKRTGESPEKRLGALEKFPTLVHLRDDLSVELAALYNQTNQPEKALAIIQSRKFQPGEGGEGLVLGQHVHTHLVLGKLALESGDAREARHLFEAALACPENLGEATHLLANQSDIYYFLGEACAACEDHPAARQYWGRAARHQGDFQDMSVKAFSEMTYYNAMALRRLNREADAQQLFRGLLEYAQRLMNQEAKINYFATSLPAMLLFDDNLQKRNTVTARFLEAQARLGLGDLQHARSLLQDVLQTDRNHMLAADLLSELELLIRPTFPPHYDLTSRQDHLANGGTSQSGWTATLRILSTACCTASLPSSTVMTVL